MALSEALVGQLRARRELARFSGQLRPIRRTRPHTPQWPQRARGLYLRELRSMLAEIEAAWRDVVPAVRQALAESADQQRADAPIDDACLTPSMRAPRKCSLTAEPRV